MSKSKGNVVTPMDLFDSYGTDAVRYWAGSARPGVDTAFSEDQMKVGRKLANKILNVSKFVLGLGEIPGHESGAELDDSALADTVTEPIDRSMLAKLDALTTEMTADFDDLDYARALERTEHLFWWFCDNYVELVKSRAYEAHGIDAAASARAALRRGLSTLQRLLAPFLPYATEEAWSWWQQGSVHRASWPAASGLDADATLIDPTIELLTLVRRAKTEAKQSQRSEVATVQVSAPLTLHDAIDVGRRDLLDAGSILDLVVADGSDELRADVTLAEPASS